MSMANRFIGSRGAKHVSRRDAIRQVAGAALGALALASLPAPGVRTASAAGVANQGKAVTIALSAERKIEKIVVSSVDRLGNESSVR